MYMRLLGVLMATNQFRATVLIHSIVYYLGLRDVDPNYQLSRLTAFQELAYLATSSDKEAAQITVSKFSVFVLRN